KNTKEPIVIDPFYSTERGTLLPTFEAISFKNVHVLTPSKITIVGTDDYHRTRIRFDGVAVDGYDSKLLRATHARIIVGPGGTNFKPIGEDVEVQGEVHSVAGVSCDNRFVPFPEDIQRASV